MKKLLSICLLALMAIGVNAQEETPKSTETKTDTTYINFGKMKIIIVDDGDDGVGQEDDGKDDKMIITVSDNGDTTKVRKSTRAELTHWGGIDIGMNILSDASGNIDFSDENEWLNLDYAHSFSWNFNVFEQKIPIAKEYVGVITGLGVNYRKFGFRDSVNLVSNADTTFGVFSSDLTYSTNKFRTATLTIPVLLEFNTNKNHKKSFHIAAGVTGGWVFQKMYKQKYSLEGKDYRDKTKREFNVNPFSVDASARIGYGNFTLFANYALTPLFKDGKGPELYPITVGLQLVGW